MVIVPKPTSKTFKCTLGDFNKQISCQYKTYYKRRVLQKAQTNRKRKEEKSFLTSLYCSCCFQTVVGGKKQKYVNGHARSISGGLT